jgi:hypothetical protein
LPGAAVWDGAFTDRLDLVAMSTVCLLRSSKGQRRWLQEIRAEGPTQGAGTQVIAMHRFMNGGVA